MWLHRIEDEELRQILADLMLDIRGDALTEAGIADVIERLRQQQARRQMAKIPKSEMDDGQKQAHLQKLKEQNPDLLQKQQIDDNLFGT